MPLFQLKYPYWLGLVFAFAACSDDGGLNVVQGRLGAPADLEFGDVQVGVRMPMTLALTNTGSGVLRVLDIEPGPNFTTDGYAFTLEERSFVLSPGDVRPLSIGFQPFAVGDAASTLTIISDGPDGPQTVALTGRGIRSGIEVVPEPIDFGAVLTGSSRTLSVRVTNRLSSPIDLFTGVDGDGIPSITNQQGRGRFELLSPEPDGRGSLTAADAPLAPGASLEVTLRYVPAPIVRDEDDLGRWVVRNCDSNLCDRTVVVTGRGTNAALECTATVDFGQVNPGAMTSQTVTCENVVNEPVTLSGWALSVDASAAFSVEPAPDAPATIAPGEAFSIDVSFAPTLAELGNAQTATLRVRGRNPVLGRDLDPAEVALSGIAGGPDIVVAPSTLAFSTVARGTTKVRRLLVTNVGFNALTVSGVEVDNPAFAVDQQQFVVLPGESSLIAVTYTPSAAALDEAEIRIISNDVDEATVRVQAAGQGVTRPTCDYAVVPASLEFGLVQVLRSTSQGVRIENVGATDCLINDIRIEPNATPYFGVETGTASTAADIVLPPGASITPLVTYTPELAGAHAGRLRFYVSSDQASNPSVDLSGFGSESALLVSPNEIDFGRVAVDCGSGTQPVSVYNTNAVTTTIDRIERPAGVSGEFVLSRLPAGLPGQNLAPGQSLSFDVRYRAADLGPDTGVVHIYETGQSAPYVVSLLGAGAAEPINEDRFVQLETPEVDILFVIDNSGSMSEEQASLTANFRSFIQFADAQALDYRIGVVSTDAFRCPLPGAPERPSNFAQGSCGYFADGNPFERNADWRLIRPDTQPDAQTAFEVVAAQGTTGSGTELGLEAAFRALSAPLITGWNAGFLRPNAYLALVFVSDEEDQSNNSIAFYTNFFLAIKGFRNTNLFSASAIVGDPDDECGPLSDPGLRYIDVAERTGGVVERICTPDWARSLQNLGLSVFGYKRTFFLRNQPAAGTVRVSIDGVDVPGSNGQSVWSYDPNANSVTFSPLTVPEPGSEIVVTYQAQCL